ncbi:hypothetical protein [Burkholderia lata]|uniref:hypothetical protein n=1 Tax=Burkholderia lata (strain ATCC 17760 / DSM 23089 / LMG 22485 / NCIMB 9086 / R18194 / 383) TaxID=482957 RepID=UPI0015837161|nr:hypothetical protein [Burkholderia lata]
MQTLRATLRQVERSAQVGLSGDRRTAVDPGEHGHRLHMPVAKRRRNVGDTTGGQPAARKFL